MEKRAQIKEQERIRLAIKRILEKQAEELKRQKRQQVIREKIWSRGL